jgi:hypothetical protein
MRMDEPGSFAALGPGPLADPVFVLCNGRSGSTLLRFVLDAHPELACPPETNLPGLCAQLATVWSLIEGAPLSATRGDEPPEIPQAAIAGVRETMDRMVGSYLARRGKKRYCDKSLGVARYAPLLARVYPEARFICVYRHPMDVIASGAEACPWGLNGYGFDPYIAATPGNIVMALASFWVDNARTTLAAEELYAERSFRLRYEDLVVDPEATAAALFEFLGVSAAPGISDGCFSPERERFGPGDHKIWYTSQITADSVGRGWSVPAGMIAPHLLGVMNELVSKLGYLQVDGDWGTTEPPLDVRVSVTATPAEADSERAGQGPDGGAGGGSPAEQSIAKSQFCADRAVGVTPERSGAAGPCAVHESADRLSRSERLGVVLRNGLRTVSGENAPGLPGPHGSEKFVAVAVTRGAERQAEYWLVDLVQGTVTSVDKRAQESSDWDLIGTWDVWEKVIDGEVNLSVALRSCELRYCDNGEASALAADTRIGIVGELLGLASWR